MQQNISCMELPSLINVQWPISYVFSGHLSYLVQPNVAYRDTIIFPGYALKPVLGSLGNLESLLAFC